MLAERPVLVEQRHADRGIGIEHLFRADDLDLVGVDIQPELLDRNLLDRVVDALDRAEFPVGAFEQRTFRAKARTCAAEVVHSVSAPAVAFFLAKSSRNTG